MNRLLLSARRQRPAPPRDDKVVAAWNGYMVTALAQAGERLTQPRARRAAQATARFILDHLYDSKRNVLYRDWRGGRRGVEGFAEDYAAVAEALLALHALDGNNSWLRTARRLCDALIARFWDETSGGGFFNSREDPGMWLRDKPATDHVISLAGRPARGQSGAPGGQTRGRE